MNLSRLSYFLPFFKTVPKFRFSPRRAILSFTGTTILATILYPQAQASFEVLFQDNEENRRRIEKCPNIKKGLYFPTLYLANGLLQCVWGANTTECDPNLQFKEEVIGLPCGGKIGMHWASHITKIPVQEKNAVVIILPGLTASAKEPYVKNITSEALDNGYEVVVYHNRGNAVEMTLPTNGYLNPFEDFKLAVEYVKAKYPEHKIFAVGHSFGANTLVNYLGRYNQNNDIQAAASIANPFDFKKAAQGLLNTVFDKYLAESLQTWARVNKEILEKAPAHFNLEYEKAMAVKSMVEFDEYITRRITGHSDFTEYYDSISSGNYLKNVSVPLLCMHSKDDPFLNPTSIPIEQSLQNKNVTMLVTNQGGHVMWFQGLLRPKRWFPKPTLEFLNACYDEIQAKN